MSEPQDDPEYQKMVDELALKCTCQPDSARPCDGLLAGGLCDDINWREGLESRDGGNDEL